MQGLKYIIHKRLIVPPGSKDPNVKSSIHAVALEGEVARKFVHDNSATENGGS